MERIDSITVTDQDMERLANVVSLYRERDELAASALRAELDRADVVAPSEVSPLVVTMNSRVLCRDDAGRFRELTLVYPWHADSDAGKVSVLAPLGRALLGAAVGETIDVGERGRIRQWWVYALRFQPKG